MKKALVFICIACMASLNGMEAQNTYSPRRILISSAFFDYQGPTTGNYSDIQSYRLGLTLGGISYVNQWMNVGITTSFAPKLNYPLTKTQLIESELLDINALAQFKSSGSIFREDALVAPYLTTGFGVNMADNNTRMYIPAALGTQINLSKHFNLYLEGMYKFGLGQDNIQPVTYALGINFSLSNRRQDPKQKPPPKDKNKRDPIASLLIDSDNDGIVDRDDFCPDEPGKAIYLGCPEDQTVKPPPPPLTGEEKIQKVKLTKLEKEFLIKNQTQEENLANFPSFPWPPPNPSAVAMIPSEVFEEAVDMGDIKEIIVKALDASGYLEKSYYKVPQGFAIATRLEQIYEDGSPKPDSIRWSSELKIGDKSASFFSTWLKAIFDTNEGHFRVIVFVVAPKIISSFSQKMPRKKAKGLVRQGSLALPSSYADKPNHANLVFTALIYEYKLLESEKQARIIDQSEVLGITHLEKAGVWQVLLSN